MVTPTVTITHSSLTPTSKIISCQAVNVGGKRNIDSQPWANINGPTEVMVNAFENQTIAIPMVFYDTRASALDSSLFTIEDVQTLIKSTYDGTDAPILTVKYSDNGTKQLQSLSGSNTVPVVLKSYTYPINIMDSKDGYMPTGSLTFVETTNS